MKFLLKPILLASISMSLASAQTLVEPSHMRLAILAQQIKMKGELADIQEQNRNASPLLREQAMANCFRRNQAAIQAIVQDLERESVVDFKPNERLISQVVIPPNASSLLEDFLVERANQSNELAALEQESRNLSTDAHRIKVTKWLKANGPRLKLQSSRAQEIADLAYAASPPTVPIIPNIPRGLSPEWKAVLTQRHALLVERLDAEERVRALPDAARNKALTKWSEQNRSREEWLQKMTKQLTE